MTTDAPSLQAARLARELLAELEQFQTFAPDTARGDSWARIRNKAEDLCSLLAPEPGAFDQSAFETLLTIAGPATSRELLAQVKVDLDGIRRSLEPAMDSLDWVVLRAQSHVLMSVAGSLGAVGLHFRAEALNRTAQTRDAALLESVGKEVMSGMERLQDIVETEARNRSPSGGPAE